MSGGRDGGRRRRDGLGQRLLMAITLTFAALVLLSADAEAEELDLKLSVYGQGQISVNGTAKCTAAEFTCDVFIPEGDPVGLKAEPAAGWKFQKWGNDESCATVSGPDCEITMNMNRWVYAYFVESEVAGALPPPGGSTPEKQTSTENAIHAGLSARWKVDGARTRVRKLLLTDLPDGAAVHVACKGGGCRFKQRTAPVKGGTSNASGLFGNHALHAGAAVTLRVTAPGAAPEVIELKIRRGRQPKVIRR